MSIRSNLSGALKLPVTGLAGDGFPLTMCCWAKVVQHTLGFGSILTMTDAFFNTAPYFGLDNASYDIIFSPGGGTNLMVVGDSNHKWSYLALSWDGVVGNVTAIGIDNNGKMIQQVAACSGPGTPPFVYIGGQLINGGTTQNDADVLYRGVHVWQEQKGLQFMIDQAGQLAPLSDVNLLSTLWPEKTIANLGYSSVGHPWQITAGWISSPDEPPVPELIKRRAFSFATPPPAGTSGFIFTPGSW